MKACYRSRLLSMLHACLAVRVKGDHGCGIMLMGITTLSGMLWAARTCALADGIAYVCACAIIPKRCINNIWTDRIISEATLTTGGDL